MASGSPQHVQRFTNDLRACLIKRRIDLGMSQYDLADKMGTHQSSVSNLENSFSRTNIGLHVLFRWLDALEGTLTLEIEVGGRTYRIAHP